jgi:hypothetical protein
VGCFYSGPLSSECHFVCNFSPWVDMAQWVDLSGGYLMLFVLSFLL